MRRGRHSEELREYKITDARVQIFGAFREHDGVLTRAAKPRHASMSVLEYAHRLLDAVLAEDRPKLLKWLRRRS